MASKEAVHKKKNVDIHVIKTWKRHMTVNSPMIKICHGFTRSGLSSIVVVENTKLIIKMKSKKIWNISISKSLKQGC